MPELEEMFGRTYMDDFSIDEIVCQNGTLVEDPFSRDINEEVEHAINSSVDYQNGYMERLITTEASKKLVNDTFDFESVKNGAEFGCGIYGWFYNYLLPEGIRWSQFDINKAAVEHNKKYTKIMFGTEPKIEFGNIYDMPLKDSFVDVIVGLSSWDSIGFFEKAIKEVDRCLESGGHFIHYQDLHVPDKVFIIAEAKKRKERGLSTDVPVETYSQTVEVREIPGLMRREYYFLGLESLDFGKVRFGDYLTKHIATLFEDRGYNIILAEEMGVDVQVEEETLKRLIENHGYKYTPIGNSFLSAYGKFIGKNDHFIEEGHIRQQSFMDVLIVRKP